MNKNSVFEVVRGRWTALLPLLGVPAEFLTGKHGPCPMCGGKDRWRFDDKEGYGSWICSQCGAGGPLKLLERMFGWGPAEVARRLEKLMGGAVIGPAPPVRVSRDQAADLEAKARAMQAKWNSAVRAGPDSAVWRYLRQRGITYDARVHLRDLSWPGHVVMLAVVQTHDDIPCQVHRTVVGADGIVRLLMPGPHPAGSCVRLMPWAQGQPIGIAEGIETALSAAQCYNMVVWAALNANRLKTWVPPALAHEVIIFADNDVNNVGRDAAVELARRIAGGVSVKLRMPTKPGFDYNDVLIETRAGDAIEKVYTIQ